MIKAPDSLQCNAKIADVTVAYFYSGHTTCEHFGSCSGVFSSRRPEGKGLIRILREIGGENDYSRVGASIAIDDFTSSAILLKMPDFMVSSLASRVFLLR